MTSNDLQIFVSFDIDHDVDLYERLLAEAGARNSGFAVCGSSRTSSATELGSERGRRAIREADQVIVLCSEHTDTATRVAAELRIAEEEGTPSLLVWGRREVMCKKPAGASKTQGMYSWTEKILRDEIQATARKVAAEASSELLRAAHRRA